jgi:hypothetical protein
VAAEAKRIATIARSKFHFPGAIVLKTWVSWQCDQTDAQHNVRSTGFEQKIQVVVIFNL